MAGKPQTLSKGQEEDVIRILRKTLLTWVLIGFAILAGLTGLSLWGIKQRTEARMESLIARQFEEPRIQIVVRDVAAERASALMTEQIAPDVSNFKDDVAKQLKTVYALVEETRTLEAESKEHEAAIQSVLTDLQKSLGQVTNELSKASSLQKDLKEISDYVLLVAKSLGDDVVAWDTLAAKAVDPHYRFAKEARDVYLSVQNQFVGPLPPPFTVMQPTVASLAQKADVSALKALCGTSGGNSDAHLAHITWTRDDLSRFQKLDVLAYIVEHTASSTARAMAGKHFAEESKQYFGHLRKNEWLDWWKENHARIKAECDKKNAEQDESTVPVEAAPSAASTVR